MSKPENKKEIKDTDKKAIKDLNAGLSGELERHKLQIKERFQTLSGDAKETPSK
ncbi:MAG: hypothetical protein ABFR02_01815 [Campylobacterota bacterium]